MEVAVIGGGAAGFFSALSCKEHHLEARVTIFEKSTKVLAKVKISGGGRCNVAHACYHISELSKFYPRGEKALKKAFSQFSTRETVKWFETRGVKLKTEADNRMFPVSNTSQTIIDCLLAQCNLLGITVKFQHAVKSIQPAEDRIELLVQDDVGLTFDHVIVAAGGSPKIDGLLWLKRLGHRIESPVPSLFSFNMPGEEVTKMMGLSVPEAHVRIQGTKLKSLGPLLITHWGMSGPAILKLSAFGARTLNQMNYSFKIQLNWLNVAESAINEQFDTCQTAHSKKKVINSKPFALPQRLWEYLLDKSGQRQDITWGEMGRKGRNKLINLLMNDVYEVKGKTTFKEEFVTCGGVSLDDVDIMTMQSKKVPGLYFAGEILDIDGVTGGFNFQAAWTTGFIAGKLK